MTAGYFITFEGIEGSGKSTQLARVAVALRAAGHTVLTTREPGGTAIGDRIRDLVLDPQHRVMVPIAELLLYAAARAQHVAERIRPALARGELVLCDRYADATAAYQGSARQIPTHTLQLVHQLATEALQPQLTVLLDIAPELGLARVAGRGALDRLEQETLAFHQRVRAGYLALAQAEPTRFLVMDGGLPEDEIHERVMREIQERMHVAQPAGT